MALLLWFSSMEALLPADIPTLQQALAAAQLHVAAVEIRAGEAEARAANVLAINADLLARNALLELQNAKMQRALYGPRSERSARLIAQLELAFEDLDADAGEAEARAANIEAINADLVARNALLELQNAKMQRALYGPRSERSARLQKIGRASCRERV